MRRFIIGLALLICPFMDEVLAQSPPTVISDTITGAGGVHPSGTVTITWSRYQDDSVPRKVIYPGTLVVPITNGILSTSLFPNSVALPPAGCYTITYKLAGVSSTRYWYVPVSPTPVSLNDIEGSLPCPTQSGVLISPAQIDGGGAQIGYTLIWNGLYYAPGPGGGGGSGMPGGTNGQVQINILGAFGGFTPGGDCVLSNPNFICTKTNGVAFAPSATINTTNANNISSGILGTGFGGTGTTIGFAQGSVVFAGAAGAYSQDNGNLFYDSTMHRMGIGINNIVATLDLVSNSNDLANPGIRIRSSDTGSTGGYLILNKNSGSNTYALIQSGDNGNYQELRINPNGGKVTIGTTPLNVYSSTGSVVLGSLSDAGYRLDVQNSGTSGTMRLYDQTAITGVTSLLMRAGAGQSMNQLITFEDNTGAPLSQVGMDGAFSYLTGGVRTALVYSNTLGLGANGQLAWRNTASWDSGSVDTALMRNAAGIVEINNGSAGTFRDLKVRNYSSAALAGSGNQCVSVDNTGLFVVAGTGACFPGSSFTAYSTTVSSQTSVTIAATTHARGTTPFAICLDNSTPKNMVFCAYSRNGSGDLVFSFNPAWSGTIEVRQ